MAELTLSNGETLTIPDDATDEQAQSYYDQAEAALKAEATADSGQPAPVDDSWFPEGERFPGYTIGHELGAGIAEGVAELPNIVPNAVNTGKSLYDLHFGSGTGEVAPEDQWSPWVQGAGDEIRRLNPQTPGWEGTRDYGRMTGTALPAIVADPLAPLAAPLLSKTGGGVGALADRYIDPNDQRKWERTGEVVGPLATGIGVKGARALPLKTVGKVAEKVATPIAVGSALLHGDLLSAIGAGVAVPRALKTVRQAAPYAAPVLNPLLDAAGPSISALLARSATPAGRDNLNRSY